MGEQSQEIFTYHKSVATINNTIMLLAQDNLDLVRDKLNAQRMKNLIQMNMAYAIGLKSRHLENKQIDEEIMAGKYFHTDNKRTDGCNMDNIQVAFYLMVKKQVIAGLIPSEDYDFTPERSYAGYAAAGKDKRA